MARPRTSTSTCEELASGDDRQWTLVMDDYQLGDDEPLTRGVSRCDHVEQRQNGGPLGKGPPSDMPAD